VRDQKQADVHVLITTEATGGGGCEYEFSFLGRRAYESIDYTLTRTIGRDATDDETREQVNQVLEIGLSPYVMKTPLGKELSLDYSGLGGSSEPSRGREEDPWNHWVFEVYGGRVEMSAESNRTSFDSRWGFYADRVTKT